jgi:hypothetical protein
MLREDSVLADSAGISSRQANVTLLAPGCSPGVFTTPVPLRQSDQQDHVIEGGAAIAEDTTGVDSPLAGINHHRNRLLHDG